MISRQHQTTHSTIAVFRTLQRLWRRTKLLWQRYAQWHQMKGHHMELLAMDDRMLKDIGLSRADVSRLSRSHKFWRHMLQPEESGGESEPGRTEGVARSLETTQDAPCSELCMCSADRSFSRN